MDRSAIINALKSTVQSWFKEDPDRVTVRAVRSHVENDLNLGQGFLENEDWKAEAKRIVKDEFNALSEEPEEQEKESKKKPAIARKHAASAAKNQTAPSKKSTVKSIQTASVDGGGETAALNEGETEEAPKRKRGRPPTKKTIGEQEGTEPPKKTPVKRGRAATTTTKKLAPKRSRAKPTVQDEEDGQEPEANLSPAYPLPPPPAVVTQDTESELSDIPNEEPSKELKKRSRPSKAAPAPAKDKEDSDSELSEVSEEPPKKKGKRVQAAKAGTPKKTVKPSSKPAELIEGPGNDFRTILQDRSVPPLDTSAGSDSEMSVVLDPTPQKGRSSSTKIPPPKKKKSSKAPAKKGRAKKADANPDTKLDPEQEQLKSLKAWLLKCGIRRIWARELAKFETPREQITHLKGILADIGMTGRYSAEKAKKIKAKRELKAELEAIQANAGSWGKGEKDDVEEVGRTRRRIGGRKARAVIEDDEEEEEDQEEEDGKKVARAREREVDDLAFMDGQSESE